MWRKDAHMRGLSKKLHSNSGASMLMALLLLLVGLVTSAVVIAAVMNAALSVKEERAQQQAYLTVSSAATLISGELERGECGSKKTVVQTYSYNYSYWSRGWELDNTTTTEDNGTGSFSEIISNGLTQIETYAGSTFHETYTISAGDNDDVSAEVFMKANEDDSTKVDLTVWFDGGTDPNKCRICLTAQGEKSSESTEGTSGMWNQYKTVTTITSTKWSNTKLQRKEVQ